jgi:LysM repeat protein
MPGAGAATASAPTHVVRSGETLAVIAKRYGVSIEEMVAANGLLSANRIFPGQRLKIPAAGAPAEPADAAPIETVASAVAGAGTDAAVTTADLASDAIAATSEEAAARRHVVRKGDTLARIAKRYSVSVEALRSRNELGSTLIHPGQVLAIP